LITQITFGEEHNLFYCLFYFNISVVHKIIIQLMFVVIQKLNQMWRKERLKFIVLMYHTHQS
jgi:hypothetical protein